MEGLARSDAGEDAVERVRQALAGRLATGNELAQPFSLIELARRFVQVGRISDAIETLQDAPSRIEHKGERWWEAEAHRVMGDLLLQRTPGAPNGAEDSYQRAIEQSRQQNAKSLELRATTSLARATRTSAPRLAIYWRRSAGGSPRASTHLICEAKALLIELHK